MLFETVYIQSKQTFSAFHAGIADGLVGMQHVVGINKTLLVNFSLLLCLFDLSNRILTYQASPHGHVSAYRWSVVATAKYRYDI